MKAFSCLFAVLLASVAFAGGGANQTESARYRCEDGTLIVAHYHQKQGVASSVDLVWKGQKFMLPLARSADGGRYFDGHLEWWIAANYGTGWKEVGTLRKVNSRTGQLDIDIYQKCALLK
ncbi:MliC family protein [Deinococcus roseus]|uniref:C-type lysozyme inhibitor domain-containing protein n=1 Tax=Deinococcus roseus TaxID=392414 RepID=A0ABQ2D9V2_9DEIO|nr:MliC family protein [Deinococcus roseus]GGJ49444.1 hypothetical protein GCM10008938_39280 [Deinococcus roseus]